VPAILAVSKTVRPFASAFEMNVDRREREGFTRWWIEESGLSVDQLYAIAVGLALE